MKDLSRVLFWLNWHTLFFVVYEEIKQMLFLIKSPAMEIILMTLFKAIQFHVNELS